MSSVPSGNAKGTPQARPATSVTVSVTRRVEPTRIPEATRWAQRGMDMASDFPGFLGSGWVRATADSLSWHMLYRFANSDQLDAWEGSEERLADFMLFRLGASDAYMEKRGHPRLRMRHIHFKIGIAERDRWLQLMAEAMDETKVPAFARSFLDQLFAQIADFMRNQPES